MLGQTKVTHAPITARAVCAGGGVRWRICGLLFLIIVLTFLDRVNISVGVRYIQLEYGLDDRQLGYVLSAYIVGYAILQIPGGLLGDCWGPRWLLTFAVLWWSLFTALTAAAPRLADLAGVGLLPGFLFVRFLVGAGEAASLPNCNKVIASWMPAHERGTGNSIFLAGVGVGGAISPPLIAWIMSAWGWRWSFVICGALGVPLAVFWWRYGRDRPEQHPHVDGSELASIQPPTATAARGVAAPWRAWARDRSIWMLLISYALQGYVTYVFYTWFYLYIVAVRGFDVQRAGFWASAPFIAVALMTPLGGLASDKLPSMAGTRWGRRLAVFLGTGSAGVFLFAGARIQHASTAVILLGLAAGGTAFAIVNWWATVNEMSPTNSGTLAGVMNTAGNIGGVISPILTPWIATRFGWISALDFAAAVILCAGACWLFLDSDAWRSDV
jgi:ACS family glucarate transporter-like MFS transporter